MKITVLGCGALGQLWMAALIKQGHEVQGWLRAPAPHFDVHLVDIDGEVFHQAVAVNDPDWLSHSDLLLVTLKAWQISAAIKNLLPLLPSSCPIALLHNGMGVLEQLPVSKQPIVCLVTTHAVRNEGNKVSHVGRGTTYIGPGNMAATRFSTLTGILNSALPDVIWHQDISQASWQKLAVNCVINPLAVRYNCANGDLRNHPLIVSKVCDEVARVMAQEGHPIEPVDLLNIIEQVIDSSAANICSMLQDIRMHRRTEIDFITGYLLQRARVHGLDLPINTQLYRFIKDKEQKYDC